MNAELSRLEIERIVAKYGCVPLDAPDGPFVERFDAIELGKAIEREINRASEREWSKITLHMDILDAALLAKHLRG
jgi:hypothetical protein